jgi:hypothetical protein
MKLRILLSIALLLTWTMSQAAMMLGHPAMAADAHIPTNAHMPTDAHMSEASATTGGHAASHDASQNTDQTGHQHDSANAECCSMACTVDTDRLQNVSMDQERSRDFTAASIVQLSAACLRLATPPPNATI